MTQRKEAEPRSSSIFNQNDPWAPTVDFADFINNETVVGEVSRLWEAEGGVWGHRDEPHLLLERSLKTISSRTELTPAFCAFVDLIITC